MKKILFVDDEPQILKSLMRLFFDSEYDVTFADGGQEALTIMEKESIDMIISDMRMPQMDGYALLSEVKERYPQTMRIILSGYADDKVVFQALQKNIAKLYMFKPWENDKLMEMIDHVFETEEMLGNGKLMEMINNIENLPTIEVHYKKIIDLINRDSDIRTIADSIESDVSIASKILQVANSAFYGVKTGSVSQAISFIGLENTKKLVLSTSIIDVMNGNGKVGRYIDKLWSMSFVTNKILAFIYEKVKGSKIPDSFSTAGLVQNIGSIFLLKYFEKDYIQLVGNCNGDNSEIIKKELELFGVTHMQIGGYLLKWWEFPYPIVEATLFQQEPFHNSILNKELVVISHMAGLYAQKHIYGKMYQVASEKIFDFLNISRNEMDGAIETFFHNMDKR